MDPSYIFAGRKPPPPPPPRQPSQHQHHHQQQQQPQPPPPAPKPKKQNQIQGPRPAALKVHQDSRKIKKPIIIYAVSPKIIHTEVSDFMSVVQRLTGLSSGDFSGDGQVSPAARLAATEKASPRERNNTNAYNVSGSDLMNIIEGLEFGQVPGILSPAPAMLPPVPSGFFSPVTDPNFFNDIINSPYGYGNSTFMVSPSALLSASLLSPLPSPDIFKLFVEMGKENEEEEEQQE